MNILDNKSQVINNYPLCNGHMCDNNNIIPVSKSDKSLDNFPKISHTSNIKSVQLDHTTTSLPSKIQPTSNTIPIISNKKIALSHNQNTTLCGNNTNTVVRPCLHNNANNINKVFTRNNNYQLKKTIIYVEQIKSYRKKHTNR